VRKYQLRIRIIFELLCKSIGQIMEIDENPANIPEMKEKERVVDHRHAVDGKQWFG
jgi:hypothetical protein